VIWHIRSYIHDIFIYYNILFAVCCILHMICYYVLYCSSIVLIFILYIKYYMFYMVYIVYCISHIPYVHMYTYICCYMLHCATQEKSYLQGLEIQVPGPPFCNGPKSPLPKTRHISLHVACWTGCPAILFSPKLQLAAPSLNARQVGNSKRRTLFLSYPRVTPELPPPKGHHV